MAELHPTSPQRLPVQTAASPILTAGGIVLAIGSLYFGSEIFVPFALAILLSFILTPMVNWLRRWRVPRIAAVLMAVTLAFIVVAAVALVVGRQLVQLADNLPKYQSTITEKIHSLQKSAPGGGVLDKVTTTVEDLGKEISGEQKRTQAEQPGLAAGARTQEPVTVRLAPPQPKPLELIRSVIGPLLAPLATAGLVVIFVIFVLLEREDLRDRFIKLAGAGDLQKSTQAINDAAARVSRYLVMQLIVNLSYGIPIGMALYFVGVPNAILWGLLAAVLRFIPYLGPFIAALFPIALSIAVDPGWTMLFWVVGLFLVAELISNNVVEPWLYGSSTGLSSLAIIVAAIFWTMLWGPVGLFLSTPLTVCVVVIGRYVPQLEFLGILLGSDPVLAPEEQLYQRLLAGNVEEAVEIAEEYVDETSSCEFYDNVAIPALRLAENDRQRSTADTNYRRLVAETASFVVREVEDHVRDNAALDDGPPAAERSSVLCIAGRTELDHAAAEMIAQVLQERSFGAKVLPPIAVSRGALGQLALHGIDAVCLSYFHPQPQVFARYVFRRVRRRAPHLKLVACCWNLMERAERPEELKQQMAADAVLASVQTCVDQVGVWIRRAAVRGEALQVAGETEPTPAASLPRIGLVASRRQELDQASRKIAQAFDVPIALLSFSDGAAQEAQESHENSLDAHVIAANDVLVSEDVTEDARFVDDPHVLEKGIRFYAGAPLRRSSGQVVGCLSLVDTQPRNFPDQDRLRLQDMANALMVDVDWRPNDGEVHGDGLNRYDQVDTFPKTGRTD
ncbi:AI-2E family transporter [Bradyrhizobium sp. 182]|uniref:AI-2E family transporter n=1 Tax=unclassified Bradyrhizobium TaxID=2631580 RepID=UPI001FFA4465|nr:MULTISPECIES: AI-2E family transporter [unclassified Bradyrhizobium]MCK1420761.1 AI-2E family transporter [Bradyrhizobium sp. CW12]MCK1528498.1 AI-2E family transporter [Bradyrhizobium sp. 182]MCK1643367.1 AI-2E family transporter [Bradyrhizobium sp. 154]